MATGTAIIDFGSHPGKLDASVAVGSQAAILTTSLVEAWLRPQDATAIHSVDEHILASDLIEIVAGNLVAGVGFTIYAVVRGQTSSIQMDGQYRNLSAKAFRVYGTFNVNWAWV